MNIADRMRLRRLHEQVSIETDTARERFSWDVSIENLDTSSRVTVLTAITEELGKLARAINKLRIAKDTDVRAQWSNEARNDMLRLLSLTERLWLAWAALPD